MSDDSIEGMFNEFDTEILSRDKEIIKLQSRLVELERQNRELVQALEQVKHIGIITLAIFKKEVEGI